jgi:hypothetical protein
MTTPNTDYERLGKNIADLANTIAGQAEAIRDGRTSGPALAMARLLLHNAGTLKEWLDAQGQIGLAREHFDAQEALTAQIDRSEGK